AEGRPLARQVVGERDALDVAADEDGQAVVLGDLEEGDDGGVAEPGGAAGLAADALAVGGAGHPLGPRDPPGDGPAQLRRAGLGDGAVRPGAELAEQLEPADRAEAAGVGRSAAVPRREAVGPARRAERGAAGRERFARVEGGLAVRARERHRGTPRPSYRS